MSSENDDFKIVRIQDLLEIENTILRNFRIFAGIEDDSLGKKNRIKIFKKNNINVNDFVKFFSKEFFDEVRLSVVRYRKEKRGFELIIPGEDKKVEKEDYFFRLTEGNFSFTGKKLANEVKDCVMRFLNDKRNVLSKFPDENIFRILVSSAVSDAYFSCINNFVENVWYNILKMDCNFKEERARVGRNIESPLRFLLLVLLLNSSGRDFGRNSFLENSVNSVLDIYGELGFKKKRDRKIIKNCKKFIKKY